MALPKEVIDQIKEVEAELEAATKVLNDANQEVIKLQNDVNAAKGKDKADLCRQLIAAKQVANAACTNVNNLKELLDGLKKEREQLRKEFPPLPPLYPQPPKPKPPKKFMSGVQNGNPENMDIYEWAVLVLQVNDLSLAVYDLYDQGVELGNSIAKIY